MSEVSYEALHSNTTPPGDRDHIAPVQDPCDTQVDTQITSESLSDVTSEAPRSTTTPPGDSDQIEDTQVESHPEHQCDDDIEMLPASTSDSQTLSSDSSPDILSADAPPPKKRRNEAAMLLDNVHQGVHMSRALCSKSRNNKTFVET